MIKFTEEQNNILKSKHDNIIIEASPGSGKTEILAEKIANDYLSTKKPFIALVFNKNASKELRERILLKLGENKLNPNSFIGTIDSFIWFIFSDFRWRINEYCLKSFFSKKITTPKAIFKYKSTSYDTKLKEAENLWRDEFWDENKIKIDNWFKDFYNKGEYVNGAIPKYYFGKYLLEMPFFKEILNIYDYLYIDEYQDLVYSDLLWLEPLKNNIGKSCLVGDTKQLIFEWMGAGHPVIKKIKSMEYKEMTMIFNHRSQDHIKKIAAEYQEDMSINLPKLNLKDAEIQEYINDPVDTLILFSYNKEVEEAMQKFEGAYFKVKQYQDNIYISEEEFNLIEPFFLWRISKINGIKFQNKVEIMEGYPELAYVSNTIIKSIFSFKGDENNWFQSVVNFLNLKIEFPEKAFQTLKDFYKGIEFPKIMGAQHANTKIMTSASCKGLQATRVIWFPKKSHIKNPKSKNNNYVCITRAKKELLFNPQ